MTEKIKFYADTPKGEKNKLFVFSCNILSLEDCLYRFILKGFYIRSAYYQLEKDDGEIINTKIKNISDYYSKANDLSKADRLRITGIPFTNNI